MTLGKQIIRSTRLPQVPGGSSQSFRSTAAVYFHVNNMVDNIWRLHLLDKHFLETFKFLNNLDSAYLALLCLSSITG